MKIVRIILAASLLLSLRSSVFASAKNLSESIQLERKDSFDPLRDANGWLKAPGTEWFGMNDQKLAEDTLKKCGKDYKDKQIRPGSNAQSIQAWDQQIQTLENAQQFLTATQNVKTHISGLPYYKKAQDLIEATKQVKREEWLTLNNASISLLKTYHDKIQAKTSEDAALLANHKAQLQAQQAELEARFKVEQDQLQARRRNEKSELASILSANFNAMQIIQQTTSNLDVPKAFVISQASISEEKLSKLASKYKDGQAKQTTYAEAIKGEK